MTPNEAAMAIRASAGEFSRAEITSRELWTAFHTKLNVLCREEPLSGDFLACFRALEAWELAEGADLPMAVDSLRDVAHRLADETGSGGPTV